MKKVMSICARLCLVGMVANLWLSAPAWGEEVPYTLEDRDRLIRVETTLRELKEQTDTRFTEFQTNIDTRFTEFQKSLDTRFSLFQKSVDDRFGQLMNFLGIISAVFGGLVAVTIGFAVWDRQTALAPAVRKSQETSDRQERLEQAFRELAQDDPKVAKILRHVGLL